MADRLKARLQAALKGKYDVGDELGSGGMAHVYQARDLNPQHPRQVAVKVLKPELASELGEERFLREIRIAARLVHPHILPLFDSGSADSLLYYVMPYVDGETLRGRLARDHQLPIEAAVRIAATVAEALAYAHSRGVIHRDIKPENILFAAGAPIVADFGIARPVAAASPDREAAPARSSECHTEPGLTVGTPHYMSPEQALGEALDGRTDVYSLGCTLYEMLAGCVPFSGPTPQAVLFRQMRDAPPSIQSVRDGVPASLERVVIRALAPNAEDRFTTAADFQDALAAPAASSTGISPQSVAVLPFTNLSGDPAFEYLGEGLAEEIITALAQVQGLRVAARTSSVAARVKGLDLEEIGARLRVATVLEGSVKKSGNHLRVSARLAKVDDGFQLWMERYDREMTDVFAIQDEIARGIAAGLQVTFEDWEGKPRERVLVIPPTANLEAYDLYLKGRHELAQRGSGLTRALALFEQAVALDAGFALAHAGIAEAYAVLAQYGFVPPDAIRAKAYTAADRALELAPQSAEAHCASGALSLIYWDWPATAGALQRAVELNPAYVPARVWLAFYLVFVQGRFDDGIAHAQRAVDLDPLAPLPAIQLGMTLLGAGLYEEAEAPLVRGRALAPEMFSPPHLGLLYNRLGRSQEALAALERAVVTSGRHPWTLCAQAVCFSTLGQRENAQAIYDELVARGRREYVQSSILALLHASLGRMDEAFALLERAYDEHDGILVYSKRYPFFPGLQADPRMQEILRRMKLS